MKVLRGTSFLLIGFALFLLAGGPLAALDTEYVDRLGQGKDGFVLWPLDMHPVRVWNGPYYSTRVAVESDIPIDIVVLRARDGSYITAIVLEDFGRVYGFDRVFPPPHTFARSIFIRFTNPTNISVRVSVTGSFGPYNPLEFVTANWYWITLISSCGVLLLLVAARWLRSDLTLFSGLRLRGGAGVFLPMPHLFVVDLASKLVVLVATGLTIFEFSILPGWWAFALKYSATLALVLGYTAFTYCVVVGDELPRWSKRTAALAFSMCVGVYSAFLPKNTMNYLSLQGLDPSGLAPFLVVVPIAAAVVAAAHLLDVIDTVSQP